MAVKWGGVLSDPVALSSSGRLTVCSLKVRSPNLLLASLLASLPAMPIPSSALLNTPLPQSHPCRAVPYGAVVQQDSLFHLGELYEPAEAHAAHFRQLPNSAMDVDADIKDTTGRLGGLLSQV